MAIEKKTIIVVDDNATNLTTAEEALEDEYRVIALTGAEQLFKALNKFSPDLILLDVKMPGIDGFEAIKQLKSDERYAEIPVIFLTSLTDPVNEAYGITLGAADFITKPFSTAVLLNRVKYHLQIDELIRERTQQLIRQKEELIEKTHQLENLQNGIVYTLSDIVENRDKHTGGHIERTSVYTEILINGMIERGVYADEISSWDIESVISSARLHDIGKILIPDRILNKPDKLDDEEFEIMKSHASQSEKIIGKMMQRTNDEDFLRNANLIAAYHHEKWNGSGYPHKLSGTDIPLQGRITAVIDVYDALVSDRPYKKAFSHEAAVRIISEDSGKHFDPAIVEVFLDVQDEILKAKNNM